MRQRLSVTTDRSGLELATAFVERGVSSVSWVDCDRVLGLRLAVHELVINIARHAYRGRPGRISLTIKADASRFMVAVVDGGLPMEGKVDRPMPIVPATAGYGLPIIRGATDSVDYSRRLSCNSWRLVMLRPEEQRP